MSFHLLVGCSLKSHAGEIRRRTFGNDLPFPKMECPLGSFQSKSFVPLGASLEQRLEKRQRVKYSEAPPLVTRLNDLSINARMATAR